MAGPVKLTGRLERDWVLPLLAMKYITGKLPIRASSSAGTPGGLVSRGPFPETLLRLALQPTELRALCRVRREPTGGAFQSQSSTVAP